MSVDGISGAELSTREVRDLRRLAEFMVPADAAYDVPGADDGTIFADIILSLGRDAEAVRAALGARAPSRIDADRARAAADQRGGWLPPAGRDPRAAQRSRRSPARLEARLDRPGGRKLFGLAEPVYTALFDSGRSETRAGAGASASGAVARDIRLHDVGRLALEHRAEAKARELALAGRDYRRCRAPHALRDLADRGA